jgi:hypothetical protein
METITSYEEVEQMIRETFENEETQLDKVFFLKEISRLIKELDRLLD